MVLSGVRIVYRKDEEQARPQRSMAAYHRSDVVTRRMNWEDRFLVIVGKSRHHISVYPRRGRACPSLIVAEKKCSCPAKLGTALTAKSRSRCGIAAKLFRSGRPVYKPARPIHPSIQSSSPNEERRTWNGRKEKRGGRKSNASSSDVCLRPFLRDPQPLTSPGPEGGGAT